MYWYERGSRAIIRFVRNRLTVLISFALLPTAAAAQIRDSIGVRGLLIDAATALPLPRVQVVITRQRDTVARLVTDSIGAFAAPARMRERLTAHFRRLGYLPDSVQFDVGEMPLRVAMNSSLAIAGLQAITIKEKAFNSFERRAGRSAAGTFISLEKIEQRKPQRTTELFRGIGGLKLTDSLGITMLWSARANKRKKSRESPGLAANGTATNAPDDAPAQSEFTNCPMRVRIDGILQPPDFSLDDIRPVDIYGIEIYLGSAAMPAEYQNIQSESECGLVLVWLKRSKERFRK